jgi:AraC-like DNA-binding protein
MKPSQTAGSIFSEPWQESLFSDLLQAIRVRRSVYFRPTFGAPWSTRLDGVVTHFHYVTSGTCWLQVQGMPEATRLSKGDLVMVPRGRHHVMCDSLDTPPVDYFELVTAHGTDRSGAFRAGGGGAVTSFLCGGLRLESGPANMLLAVLPASLHVRGHAAAGPLWLDATVAHLLEELQNGRGYREPVVSRLAELLFVQTVRAYLNVSARQVQTGWLAALRDRRVGQALALMHSQPEERWTVAALASRLAVSRSAFAEKFSQLLGESPHRYLARLRLNIASERLRTTDDKIATIASFAGYQSLPAFSKAFKQELGASPVEYRRMRRLRQRD